MKLVEQEHKIYYNSKTKQYYIAHLIRGATNNFLDGINEPLYLVVHGRKGGVIKHELNGWDVVSKIQQLLRNGYDMITIDEIKKIKHNIVDEIEKLKVWYLLQV